MKRFPPRLVGCIGFCLLLMVSSVATAQPAGDPLAWPARSQTSKPWTRWWWLGSILNEADVTTEMEKYAKAGIGGLEITPIYGVKGQEDKFLNYLDPAWMKQFAHVLKEAKRLDLGIDIATGNGWPFGGPWVKPDDACRYLAFRTFTIAGGQKLSERIVATDPVLVRTIGRQVTIDQLKDPIGSNAELQQIAPDQIRFPRPLPLMTLMAFPEIGQPVDLTRNVADDGSLDWTAPVGNWKLQAVFLGWHGKQVERAGPGGEGDVIDHFNSDSLLVYLKKFDDAFAGHDVSGIRAFFNDSYEVDDATGESNITRNFFAEFDERRGYDLREHLNDLLANQSTDVGRRVLTDYRETISDLLLDEFTIPWQKWAEKQGALVRNQAHGSPANILDLYAASGIPEQEGRDSLRFKFASSAAHVTGKQLASCEAATWLNDHWLATLSQVKDTVDLFFLGGINHVCYHGTAYSPPNEPWPGHLFYAAVEFQPINPFWNDFGALNAYVGRTQSFLQAGKPDNDILVYYPIHDLWSQPAGGAGRGTGARGAGPRAGGAPADPNAPQAAALLQHFAGPTGESQTTGETLIANGYTFDYISDRQIAATTFANGSIRTSGGTNYKAILVPQCTSMPLETLRKLVELSAAGAKVIFQSMPTDVPGFGNLAARRAELQTLTARLPAQSAGSVPEKLAAAGLPRETMTACGLRFERRAMDGGKAYFIYNPAEQAVDGWVPLASSAASAALFDAMTGRSGMGAVRSTGGKTEVYLQLQPKDSTIVQTFDAPKNGAAFAAYKAGTDETALTGPWAVRFTTGGPVLPANANVSELISWTEFAGDAGKVFGGTAVYSIQFAKPASGDAWTLDLGTVAESARVSLNGREIAALIKAPYQVTITPDMLMAQNTLEVAVSNLAANRIADMDKRGVPWKKFYNTNMPSGGGGGRGNRGADGQFSAATWEPRPSGLLGPVKLVTKTKLDVR
jgi:hypothetical protein